MGSGRQFRAEVSKVFEAEISPDGLSAQQQTWSKFWGEDEIEWPEVGHRLNELEVAQAVAKHVAPIWHEEAGIFGVADVSFRVFQLYNGPLATVRLKLTPALHVEVI